jgi:hypothetical protein
MVNMMSKYAPDALVTVHPYSQHVEGDEVTIANATQSAFLSLPSAAIDLLIGLAQGKTVGETQAAFANRYGETPDMVDFLEVLEREGFVVPCGAGASPDTEPVQGTALQPSAPTTPQRRYHFERISQDVAQRLCGRAALIGGALVIALSLALIVRDPALLPPPHVMVVTHNLTLFSVAIMAFTLITIFLHELAHLVASRAVGVSARMGIGNRLWVLVAETDMSGIWLVPRHRRYLPLLAGPLLDAVSAAVLVIVLAVDRQRWLTLPPAVLLLCRACLLTYLVRLLWQCYFFVRTDFYYGIATVFDCKSLMSDTEAFLHNKLAQIIPSIGLVDQSAIPARERRVIGLYAVIWLVGRVAAFGSLFAISLPILWGYAATVTRLMGGQMTTYAIVDTVLWSLLAASVPLMGLTLWLRGLYESRRRRTHVLAA